jgi:hypothetical protein
VEGQQNGQEKQSVNYIGLIGILIKEIQDLKQKQKQTSTLMLVPTNRPTEEIKGTIYYDKNDNKMYYYNGIEWI